tara:strand:+ start:457 stop:600 length:144 start_codon:yes stop_codon:yes gene_type:complete
MNFINHIWKNYKTTIAAGIGYVLVFLIGRDLIAQDTAQLIAGIVSLI